MNLVSKTPQCCVFLGFERENLTPSTEKATDSNTIEASSVTRKSVARAINVTVLCAKTDKDKDALSPSDET